mgnify:CR=1 FL=1
MRRLEKSREIYENIAVPEELEGKVEDAIRHARKRRETMKKEEKMRPIGRDSRKNRKKNVYRWTAGIAAAFAAAFIVGLNTSEAFAMGAQGLPVIGELAKILTVRSYERKEEDIQIDVEVPGVELADRGLSEEVNAQIEKAEREYDLNKAGSMKKRRLHAQKNTSRPFWKREEHRKSGRLIRSAFMYGMRSNARRKIPCPSWSGVRKTGLLLTPKPGITIWI